MLKRQLIITAVVIMTSANVVLASGYWSLPQNVTARFEMGNVSFPFYLTTSESVYGLSCDMLFDPTAFSEPQFKKNQLQDSAFHLHGFLVDQGKVLSGVMIRPAKYRVIIYSNPIKALNKAYPVFDITLNIDETRSVERTLSFESTTASDSSMNKFSGVTFAPITVRLNYNNVNCWALYE